MLRLCCQVWNLLNKAKEWQKIENIIQVTKQFRQFGTIQQNEIMVISLNTHSCCFKMFILKLTVGKFWMFYDFVLLIPLSTITNGRQESLTPEVKGWILGILKTSDYFIISSRSQCNWIHLIQITEQRLHSKVSQFSLSYSETTNKTLLSNCMKRRMTFMQGDQVFDSEFLTWADLTQSLNALLSSMTFS